MAVAVVGAGITGLTAAYRLAVEHGLADVHVFEASSRIGGVIGSVSREGFIVDIGPDAFVITKPEALALARELGLAGELIETEPSARGVLFLKDGKLIPLPDGMQLGVPTQFLSVLRSELFPLRTTLRMGLDWLIPRGDPDVDESIASFLERRLGKGALEIFGEPLLGGIYSGDPRQLSLASTFPQLSALEQKHGSLIRGTLKNRRAARAKGAPPPSPFASFKGGMQTLVDRLGERLREAGVTLHLNSRVLDLGVDEGRERLTVETDGRADAHLFDAVILALPSLACAKLIGDRSPKTAALLRAIPNVSTAACLLGFDEAEVSHPMNAVGLLIPRSEGRPASAVTFMSRKWAGRAPPGKTLLRIFFGGHAHPEVGHFTREDVVALAREELRFLFGVTAVPQVAEVSLFREIRPQPTVGHRARLHELRAHLASDAPRIAMAGAPFDGVGIPDCVRQGREVALSVAQWMKPHV